MDAQEQAKKLIDSRDYDEVAWILALNAELNERHTAIAKAYDFMATQHAHLRDVQAQAIQKWHGLAKEAWLELNALAPNAEITDKLRDALPELLDSGRERDGDSRDDRQSRTSEPTGEGADE